MSIKEEREIILSLRGKNYTYQEIANKFGRSLYWVYGRVVSKYAPNNEYKSSEILSKVKDLKEHYKKFPESITKKAKYKIIKENYYNIDSFLNEEQARTIFKEPIQKFGNIIENSIAKPILKEKFITKRPAEFNIEAWSIALYDPKVIKLRKKLDRETMKLFPKFLKWEADKKECKEAFIWLNNHPLSKLEQERIKELVLESYKNTVSRYNSRVSSKDVAFLKESIFSPSRIDFFCIPKPDSGFLKPFYFVEIKGERSENSNPSFSSSQKDFIYKFKNKIGILALWIFLEENKAKVKWLAPN